MDTRMEKKTIEEKEATVAQKKNELLK